MIEHRYGFPNTPADYNPEKMGDFMCVPIDYMLGDLPEVPPHSGLKFIALGSKDNVLGPREIWVGFDSTVPHLHLINVALKQTKLLDATLVDAGAVITKDNSHEWYVAGYSDLLSYQVHNSLAVLNGSIDEKLAATRATTTSVLQRKGNVYGINFLNGRPSGMIWNN